MTRRLPALACLLALAAQARAQAPPPGDAESGRVFCEQSVSYRVVDPATVPEPYRRFLGVWSDAAWDPNTCAALIVEDVQPDGAARIIYVYGPQGSGAGGPGGVLNGAGVIRDDELRFENADRTQFSFKPSIVDLIGRMTTPTGATYQSPFKKTP